MTEPNFSIRQNVCVRCGRYIWAHPYAECQWSVLEAQLAYEQQVQVNRMTVKGQNE